MNPLLENFVEIDGKFIHKSYLTDQKQSQPKTNVQPKNPKEKTLAPEIEPKTQPENRFQKEIEDAYDNAYAILTILNFKVHSTNELKWKHWTYHHKERKQTNQRIRSSSFWKIPFGGLIPQPQTEPAFVKLTLIKYGGKTQDLANYANGCKSILDTLKTLKYIHDDSPKWIADSYYQIPGGQPKLEILFQNAPDKTSHRQSPTTCNKGGHENAKIIQTQ